MESRWLEFESFNLYPAAHGDTCHVDATFLDGGAGTRSTLRGLPVQTRPGDSGDLARQIQWLVDRPQVRHQMGTRGRAIVLRQFDLRQQAARHLELYQTLLRDAATVAATGRAA